ncbi:MAG: S-layer homology domain-containing protein, partial [Chloroflexia bacterium]
AATDAFYQYIETAYRHGIISGYECGTGCLEFRSGNNATRGQISKIVYLAVTGPQKTSVVYYHPLN